MYGLYAQAGTAGKSAGTAEKGSCGKRASGKKEDKDKKLERAYLQQNLIALLQGKYTDSDLAYVKAHMEPSHQLRYLYISPGNLAFLEELADSEVRSIKNSLYEQAAVFLGEDADFCLGEIPGFGEDYEIGMLYCDAMSAKRGLSEEQFLEKLRQAAGRKLPMPVILLLGKEVEELSVISHSYSTASVLRSFRGFRAEKNIYYYEKEIQAPQNKIVLCKQNLDLLLRAVEQNDKAKINHSVDDLYAEMETLGMSSELISMNINYLLFQMIHLAVEQDEAVNQEEVMLYISENVSKPGTDRGSRAHLRRFAGEYAEYLIQLRKNVSRGILTEIEREIREHYAENLTLRELSRKYYVNSSYLGQIFRKKYGQSFKDYLGAFRISKAAEQLLYTDKKISQIGEEAGYHDTDYFISRFIELKGCTPARYRRNLAGEKD